mgnify:CR=1 FL=1
MKKLVILMMMINVFVFSNSLSKINSLTAKVNEKTIVNKNKKEKSYSFIMKYPDKAYKEMLSPKINVGEKYIYNGKKKMVYYPLLKNKFIEDIDEDENYILEAIKEIKLGRKSMKLENDEVKELNLGDGTRIVFYDYKKVDGINFPSKVEVYEGKNLYSTLVFSEVKINKNVDDEIFKIN